MSTVFLSYRRNDSEAIVGRIADRLADALGRNAVFRDIESLKYGADFPESIARAIEQCEIVLVVIGPNWLSQVDAQGNRRLDSSGDFVRREIEQALRTQKLVIPLVLDNAATPSAEELPESLRKLARLHAITVRGGADFEMDLRRLIRVLEENSPATIANRNALGANALAQSESGGGLGGAKLPLLVAAVALAAGLGLLLVMLLNAEMLVGLGLVGHLWYVLLLMVGLAAAVTVFSLFRSYARFSGKVLGGTLEIGGPVLAILAVVTLGLRLVEPPSAQFDFTVFLNGSSGKHAADLRNSGKLFIDLGADRRTEAIGDKGEVRFVGIPANMRGRRVPLALDADKYELVDGSREVQLDPPAAYANVQPKQLGLSGDILDAEGRPLAEARVAVAGYATTTDRNGRFELRLPADLPEGDRTLTISVAGYETWRGQSTPGGNRLRVQLTTAK